MRAGVFDRTKLLLSTSLVHDIVTGAWVRREIRFVRCNRIRYRVLGHLFYIIVADDCGEGVASRKSTRGVSLKSQWLAGAGCQSF